MVAIYILINLKTNFRLEYLGIFEVCSDKFCRSWASGKSHTHTQLTLPSHGPTYFYIFWE